MYETLKEAFHGRFGRDAEYIFSAPGRTELSGNHTDHQHGCVLAAAVTLESVAELTACLKKLPFAETEVVSVTAARSKQAGPYHLMTGLNPVYLFTMEGTKE